MCGYVPHRHGGLADLVNFRVQGAERVPAHSAVMPAIDHRKGRFAGAAVISFLEDDGSAPWLRCHLSQDIPVPRELRLLYYDALL